MSAPAIVIRIPLEGRPVCCFDCRNEAEELRLFDWLRTHPELLEIVSRTLELVVTEERRVQ